MIRVGLIGLDMSHAPAFAEMLNAPSPAIAGARVVAGWSGGSPDWDLSWSRVGEYTRKIRDEFGVPILSSPTDVAAASDVVLVTAADGRVHRDLFEPIAPLRKPTFVGKPIALSLADTRTMFDLAAKHGTPLMSSSALRFADFVPRDRAGIVGCDAFGPGHLQSMQPGYFWYGIHCVEMVVATMGVGCQRVSVESTDLGDVITLRYADGRLATIRQQRDGFSAFGLAVHRASGSTYGDTSQSKTSTALPLLRAVLDALSVGVASVLAEETIEVVRIVEAMNRSRFAGASIDVT